MNNAEQDLCIIDLERRITHLSQSLSATDRLSERLLRRLMILEHRMGILEGNVDPMAPDYAALAAELEPVLAAMDSRKSAGLEG